MKMDKVWQQRRVEMAKHVAQGLLANPNYRPMSDVHLANNVIALTDQILHKLYVSHATTV